MHQHGFPYHLLCKQDIEWKSSTLHYYKEWIVGCSICYAQTQILFNGYLGDSSHRLFSFEILTTKEGSQAKVYRMGIATTRIWSGNKR